MRKEQDLLHDFVRAKNLKLTSQREEILNIFLRTERHLTTEGLYHIVKTKNANIGQATVFRTLKLLCAAGIARRVDLGDKRVRYEHKVGHEHHDHLVCTKCGKFIEAIDPGIEKLQDRLCKKFKFSPAWHKMQIFGICKKCKTGGM